MFRLQTTHQQISEARDHLILRMQFQRWRQKMTSQQELHERVTMLANNRLLRATFTTWNTRMKAQQQAAWRKSMRTKMNGIRRKREERLRKDAWAKWRQSYKSHLSEQHYAERLVLRFYRCWKEKLQKVDHLTGIADQVVQSRDGRMLEHVWSQWSHEAQLRGIERLIRDKVGLRITGEVMELWKNRLLVQLPFICSIVAQSSV